MRTYYQGALPWTLADRDDVERQSDLPFLGFLAGTVLSAGIWGALVVALWVVSNLPV